MTDAPTRLRRFGSSAEFYIFPETQQAYRDNFANVVPRTVRLPGLSGGFDQYGSDPAPFEIGLVSIQFVLVAETRGEMQAKRDAVNRMAARGLQRLYMQPGDLPERFCEARVNNINMPQDFSSNTDLYQPVTVDFQVPDPYWYTLGTEAWKWGDGTGWGGGKWGGSAQNQPLTFSVNDFVVAAGGIHTTFPRITLTNAAGGSIGTITIQRRKNGVVVDQIAYSGTLTASQVMEINTRALSVKINGANAYGSAFTWLKPSWFRLEPGDNDIRVSFGLKQVNPTITFNHYTRW